MRRWWRRLLWSLTGSTVLLLGLLLALPWLLKPTLNQWANQALQWSGVGAGQVQISQWSWHKLVVDDVDITLIDGSQIHVQQLQLSYRPLALLRGEFQQLSIESIDIEQASERLTQVAQRQAQRSGAALLQQQLDLPPLQQWLQIPLGRIQIDRLVLRNEHLSSQLQARFDEGLWRLWGRLQLPELTQPWQLEAQLQVGGAWLLMLSEQQQRLLQWHGHILQKEGLTELEVNQYLNLALLQQRLPALPLTALNSVSGKLTATLPSSAKLPQDLDISAAWQLQTDTVQSANAQIKEADVQLQIEKRHQQPWQFSVLTSTINASQEQHQLQLQAKLQASCQANLQQCQLDGQLPASIQADDTKATLQLDAAGQWNADTGLQLQLPISASAQPANEQLSLRLDASGEWQLSWQPESGLTLHSERGLQLTAQGQINSWKVPAWHSQWLQQMQLSCQPQCQLLSPLKASWQAVALTQTDAALITDVQLQPGDMECSLASDIGQRPLDQLPLLAHCQLNAATKPSHWQGWQLADTQLSVELALASDRLNGQLQITAGEKALALQADFRRHQQRGGHLQWYLQPTELAAPALELNSFRSVSKIQWLSGQLSGQGWLHWQPDGRVQPDMTLRLANVSANIDNRVALEGWHGFTSLRQQGPTLAVEAQLAGDQLNPGIALTDSLLRLSAQLVPLDVMQPWTGLDYITAQLHEGRTRLLGGTVRIPEARYDSRKDINAFGIAVDHIELQQVAALEAKAEVQATGVMDGVLPIVIGPQGPEIPAGKLFARAPGGTLSYHNQASAALGSSNDTVAMAMTLLQDFQYNELESAIRYQPDGSLNLGLAFAGHNPDFFDGQSTRLNVNLEYNLLDLLHSLRVTDNLVQELEQKYQPHK